MLTEATTSSHDNLLNYYRLERWWFSCMDECKFASVGFIQHLTFAELHLLSRMYGDLPGTFL